MTASTPTLSADQRATLALWYEVNASLSAYHKLISYFDGSQQAWSATLSTWRELGIHQTHLLRHEHTKQTVENIDKITAALDAGKYQLIFADQPEYPTQLLQIYDPPPLLFCRGNSARLQQAQIAMVGSRKPTPHAQKTTFDMAQYLAQVGYVITSGLAVGVDKCAHLGALTQDHIEHQGRTIGVMGTGIDVCYPTHHEQLFTQIVEQGGCLVSELLPHTLPHKHTFPRRNRLVAGLSLATIVTEATIKSGSLITARLTSEQGKQVFAIPSHIDNTNATGCLHLIREGATLIYHPEQVLDDVDAQLTIPAGYCRSDYSKDHSTKQTVGVSSQSKASKSASKAQPDSNTEASNDRSTNGNISTNIKMKVTIPEHLTTVYEQLDWHGQDLDALLVTTKLSTAQLIAQLMELELLGVINEQGGRYLRL